MIDKIEILLKLYEKTDRIYTIVVMLSVGLLLTYLGGNQVLARMSYDPTNEYSLQVERIYPVTKYIIQTQYVAKGSITDMGINRTVTVDVSKSDYDEYKKGMVLLLYKHSSDDKFIYKGEYDESFLSLTVAGIFIPGYFFLAIIFFSGIPLMIYLDRKK